MTARQPFAIDCIVGTRPNFVKIAPILRALRSRPGVVTRLVHTGQHYDFLMDAVFFEELRIPAPDINLGIGSGTAASQIARMMLAFERVFSEKRPDLVIVVGDVNSTLGAALAATKMSIPVAHVEAGLRSWDRSMPEEVNRVLVDQIASLHFVTEPSGMDNLARENIAPEHIHLVGNVMIDSLLLNLDRAIAPDDTFAEMGVAEIFRRTARTRGYLFATLHRPGNVDDPAKLEELLRTLERVSRKIPLVFAIHPRTRSNIANLGLDRWLVGPMLGTTGPLSYLRTLGMMQSARAVITDSGGIQEETTALGVPCLTMRENTERPITIAQGTNVLIGLDMGLLEQKVAEILAFGGISGRIPPLWDGKAAERIAEAVLAFLARAAVPAREACPVA